MEDYHPLSDNYISPFRIEYSKNNVIFYNTVQHMIEATKINLTNPEQAYQYTLNSGSQLSVSTVPDSRSNHKDWQRISRSVIFLARKEKFEQNLRLRSYLLQYPINKLDPDMSFRILKDLFRSENDGYIFTSKEIALQDATEVSITTSYRGLKRLFNGFPRRQIHGNRVYEVTKIDGTRCLFSSQD